MKYFYLLIVAIVFCVPFYSAHAQESSTYVYAFQHNSSLSAEAEFLDIMQIVVVLIAWVSSGVLTYKATKNLFS